MPLSTIVAGKRIAILAEDLYEDLELWYPLLRFREAGAEVVVVGPGPARTHTSKHGYEVPRGFIPVTRENKDTYISEHFKLGDFLCKTTRSLPSFEALDMRLVQKLEILIQKLSSEGYPCTGLRILSGFRTPAYNRSRNAARESQHMYGGASDIVVDENGDGRMDDLDGDRKVTRKDADLLAKKALALNDVGIFVGGYASYSGRRLRGPFVHVDIRGQSVTWRGGGRRHYHRHRHHPRAKAAVHRKPKR